MDGRPERPRPEDTRPALTSSGQAWRLVASLAFGLVVWSQAARVEWDDDRTIFWFEIILGVIALALVIFRRRAPVLIAAVLACLSCFSGIASGPATLSAISMATLRRPLPIIGIGLLNGACGMTYTLYAPFDLGDPIWISVVINLVFNTAMMGWGMYIGSRRELVWTLRHRASRAESEQELRVAQGRSQERERIAREMHDVLAHRITQISMRAGALSYREDLEADQLRRGLGEIRAASNEAINDLRGVLGVLRDTRTGEPIDGPQPTYSDIAALIAESLGHGIRIEFSDRVDRSVATVPDVVGRALYRIIQEGLTNSTKHAPGAFVSVALSGSPEQGIDVLIRNPLGFAATSTPGAGLGLVGLAERAELRGGTLVHGRRGSLFVLHGSIPWNA